jgi:hypothetical protein
MNWMFPIFTQSPGHDLRGPSYTCAAVPVDDTYTISFVMAGRRSREMEGANLGMAMAPQEILPNTTDWWGRFRPGTNLANDLRIDREAQRFEKNTFRG